MSDIPVLGSTLTRNSQITISPGTAIAITEAPAATYTVDVIGPFADIILTNQTVPVDGVASTVILNSGAANADLTLTAVTLGNLVPADTITLDNTGGTAALSVLTEGPIVTSAVNAGGEGYRVGDVGAFDGAGNADADYVVATVTPTVYAITAVDQIASTFTVAGDKHNMFTYLDIITVAGSTGNDGTYTVLISSLVGGDTELVVMPAPLDPTADGNLSGPPGAVATFTYSATGSGYLPTIVAGNTSPGTGAGSGLTIDVTAVEPRDIVVTLATTLGVITSTANDVAGIIAGDNVSAGGGKGAADAATVAVEGTGLGVVDAFGQTPLVGGVDGTPGTQGELMAATGNLYFCTADTTTADAGVTAGSWKKVSLVPV